MSITRRFLALMFEMLYDKNTESIRYQITTKTKTYEIAYVSAVTQSGTV